MHSNTGFFSLKHPQVVVFFGTWWFGQLLVGAFHLESSEKDPKNPWKNEGFLRPKNMGYN